MAYSIKYTYLLNDKMSAAFNKMADAAGKFDQKMSKSSKSLGNLQNKLGSVGSKMASFHTALAGLGAGAVLKDAVTQTDNYRESLANIGTLIPGQTERLNSLNSTISSVAVSMGKDMTDISDGAYQVISAFGDMQGETEGRLKAVTKAAVAGGSSTTDALNLLSAVTKGYGDTSTEALQKASDLSFLTVKLGQTDFPQLAASMGKVVPSAATLGVSQEQLFAGFATLTGVTGSAAEVSTQLSSVLSSIISPTDAMAKAVKKMGYANAAAMVKAEGLSGTLNKLNEYTKGDVEAVGDLFGQKEAMTAFFALTGAQAGKFNDAINQMGDAAKSSGQVTQDAFNEVANGVNKAGFSAKQFNVVMQSAKIQMGSVVRDALGPILVKMTAFIQSMQEAHPGMLKTITYVLMGVTAVSAILVPMGLLISSLSSVIGVVKGIPTVLSLASKGFKAFNLVCATNPFGAIVLGAVALISILVKLQQKFQIFTKAWNAIKGVASKVKDAFSSANEAMAANNPYMYTAGASPAMATQTAVPTAEKATSPAQATNSTTELNLSVYKQSPDIGVKPFSSSGNLGYNYVK